MKPSDNASHSPLMTVSELAEYLKVSHSMIYRLRRDRHLPFLKLGGSFYFDPIEIERWIAERQNKR
jgi:excisionase family DNA binding protein